MNLRAFFIFSKKAELQKYFMCQVDVHSSFTVSEEDTDIVGVKNEDIIKHLGKRFFDAIITYYDKDSERFINIEKHILEDDIIYLAEKEAMMEMIFKSGIARKIIANRCKLESGC